MRLLLIFIIACSDPAPPTPSATPTAPTLPAVPEVEVEVEPPSLPIFRLDAFASGLRASYGEQEFSTPLAVAAVPGHSITSIFADGVLPVAVVWHERNVSVWVLDSARSNRVTIQPAFGAEASVRHPPSGITTRNFRLLDVDGDGARDLVVYRTRTSDVGAHTVRSVYRYLDGTFREDRSLTQRAPRNARPWRGELREPADIVARALEVASVTLGPPISLASTSFETPPLSMGLAYFGGGEFFAGREIVTRAEINGQFHLVVLREINDGFEVLSHASVPGQRGPLPTPEVFETMAPEARQALDDPCVRSGPMAIEVFEGGPRGARAIVWRHASEGRQQAVVFTWDGESVAQHSTHELGECTSPQVLSIAATRGGPRVVVAP